MAFVPQVVMCTVANGVSPIMLSFVQKTYGMETNFYLVSLLRFRFRRFAFFSPQLTRLLSMQTQQIESYGHLGFGLISTFLLSYFHKIELDDTITIFVGLCSLFFYNFIRGVVLYPIGLYLSYLIGSIYLCAIVACRGLTSKIIPEREIGTILGALSVLYASSPVFGSLIYTQTFNLTIEHYLGTAFLAGSTLIAAAVGVSVALNLHYKKYRSKMAEKNAVAS